MSMELAKQIEAGEIPLFERLMKSAPLPVLERHSWYLKHMWDTYDHSILAIIIANSMNRGARSVAVNMMILIYKNIFFLNPQDRQLYFALIFSP
jgi:hypothetical protein